MLELLSTKYVCLVLHLAIYFQPWRQIILIYLHIERKKKQKLIAKEAKAKDLSPVI